MHLIYDGTFEGYLCLIYEVYYKKLSVDAISKKVPHANLFEELYEISYNHDHANRVHKSLKERFTKNNYQTIMHIFLCDKEAFELPLLHFIMIGFKSQKELTNITNPIIIQIRTLERELFRANHKFSGFLRFRELEDGTLYAIIESKFNLLYFQGQHFSKRFNNQKFIIHDHSRALAYLHMPEFKGVRSVADFELPIMSFDETKFQKLWRTFFQSVAIESRTNPKAQRNFVPLHYRLYMSEFDEET